MSLTIRSGTADARTRISNKESGSPACGTGSRHRPHQPDPGHLLTRHPGPSGGKAPIWQADPAILTKESKLSRALPAVICHMPIRPVAHKPHLVRPGGHRPQSGWLGMASASWITAFISEISGSDQPSAPRCSGVVGHNPALSGAVGHNPRAGAAPLSTSRHARNRNHGISLAVSLTGGHRNDVTRLMPLIRAIPPVRGRRGRPRHRPGVNLGDTARRNVPGLVSD